ncbi:MAG: CPBP family intramembrane glutamic endopeptidase [Acidobacteriota bacterium]
MSGTAGAAAHENRLFTYASTVFSEVLMLAWVYLGLRLRKVPFRSLFGNLSGGTRSFFLDLGIAGLFWIGSLIVLGTINVTWFVIDAAVHHHSFFGPHGKPMPPNPGQQHLLHTLGSLAPSNGREVLAWAVVCAMAGLIEELVFRGYFQRQFTAWGRGAIVWGVVLSASMFGLAHGYQGIHNMVLLSTFGVLFSLVVVLRGNLRPAIFAHAWNDFIMGLLLMVARARHLI